MLKTILFGDVIPILQILKLRPRKAEMCTQASFSVSYQGHCVSFLLLLQQIITNLALQTTEMLSYGSKGYSSEIWSLEGLSQGVGRNGSFWRRIHPWLPTAS